MRLTTTLALACATTDVIAKAVVAPRVDAVVWQPVESQHEQRDTSEHVNELAKRRGGGGGGGSRGGGSSSGSSGSSSSGSSGSSSGSSSGGSGGTSGGRSSSGSGPSPAYGGGKYYGGGAAVPYKSGGRSPSGLVPIALVAGIGVGAAFWVAGSYMYHYHAPYSYYNSSSRQNETKPVTCGCLPEQVCGCDENNDPQYLRDIVGNGTNLNSTLVSVAAVDGVQRIIINGTLPEGTTAAGGNDNAGAGMRILLQNAGFWPVVAVVSAMVLTI